MGMFDTFNLIEPLPCYECNSTTEDNVGLSLEEELKKAENDPDDGGLKFIRLHDGKGGIKNFQTKDLQCIMADYFFPGFIPDSDILSIPSEPLYLIEVCNNCEAVWGGELFLEHEKTDNIHITTQLKIFPDEEKENSDLKWKVPSETEFYNISLDGKSINLFPKINEAINYYLKQKESFESKTDVYKSFLDSITNNKVPIGKIKKLLEGLINSPFLNKKTAYKNKLANSLDSYNSSESKMVYTRSALKSALVILSHYDEKASFDILDMSGLETKDEFIEDIEFYDWFFKPEDKDAGLERVFGILGGPNYFFNELKEK